VAGPIKTYRPYPLLIRNLRQQLHHMLRLLSPSLNLNLPHCLSVAINRDSRQRPWTIQPTHQRTSAGSTIMSVLVIMVLASSLSTLPVFSQREAQAQAATEYEVKTAYLYQFTKFITWPASPAQDPEAPASVCILGTDPFGTALQALEDKTMKQRRISVKRFPRISDATDCLILFIGRSEQSRIVQILTELHDHPVLTVSDIEGFVLSGGIIEFVPQGTTIRFAINAKAAAEAGIQISAKLLQLATYVKAGPYP